MQSNEQKLEAVTETVITIPFGGSDDEDDFEEEEEEEIVTGNSFPCRMYTPPELSYRDLPDGPRLRMRVYEDAFSRCKTRMQVVLRRIHAPTTKRVIDAVKDAYFPNEEDRLMPYTELRVVAISGTDRSATSSVLEDVRHLLGESGSGGDGEEGEELSKTRVIVSRLTPADCPNLTSAMKTMISGFLNWAKYDCDDEEEKERDNLNLAPCDVNLLVDWYNKLRRYRDEDDLPKLVVLITDLEGIEPAIMQDLFYICSLHIPHLPLVFILGLSTPPTSSYLHAAFTRKTLALLRVTRVEVAGGINVLERVLKDTFFDPSFEPTIMLSPAVLAFIVEQYTRTVQSIDFVISLLKLMYLRHFVDPLSALAPDELLGTASVEDAAVKLSSPAARTFLLALLARLHHLEKLPVKTSNVPIANGSGSHGISKQSPLKSRSKGKGKGKSNGVNGAPADANWHSMFPLHALKRVRDLRRVCEQRLRCTRMAFRITCEVRRWLLDAGEIREEAGRGAGMGRIIGTEIEMMTACLRGTLAGREGKVLANGIRRLGKESLGAMLQSLETLMLSLPSEARTMEEGTLELFGRWSSSLDELPPEDNAGDIAIADEVESRFVDYISENSHNFTETELWDIWYTGGPAGIADIFNPAPRAAVMKALVHPERYLGNEDRCGTKASSIAPMKGKGKRRAGNDADGADLEDLAPDTALLFKGYLESGRMINVYDWYASFKEGLTARRRAARAGKELLKGKKGRRKAVKTIGGVHSNPGSVPPSPTKRRGRGRGRGRGATGRGRGTRGGKSGRPDAESEGSADDSETSDESEDELSPEERERWEAEIQARFIRSVQELDLLGFIKHTGRKADHVQKTVYELPEYT